ncbi:hypothetical protein DPMN_051552 [Dreissena polymorpha]|uniref:Secreted protein n=1 Tax=Dreissena polymorpha TaxID=45954 RepID=A0A9D4CI17_DREPO|nr:hypothetical protein DPMN_051552 [Dreissena polymorpha]
MAFIILLEVAISTAFLSTSCSGSKKPFINFLKVKAAPLHLHLLRTQEKLFLGTQTSSFFASRSILAGGSSVNGTNCWEQTDS